MRMTPFPCAGPGPPPLVRVAVRGLQAQLLYTVNGIKHPPAASNTAGAEPAQNRKSGSGGGGGGGGGGGILGVKLTEISKALAARRGQKPPPPPPLTRAGVLRLVEAARLALERLGDAEETMNLAESAWALMFGWVGGWVGGRGGRGDGCLGGWLGLRFSQTYH